ncbi:D-alanyl-D-alanine carboxypeptidase family protein [Chakrabartyella piscis]|uniref:D-alanyl-D-alanine carboxypeptidase family protein n=1 Tax=Chakrabartyella piscis TaxID=2918914 RepID=UPI0029589AD7|nr:D-alanyl-D-alanine carboxypeptidase family protein [Chakrabartyella piscis]
MKKRWISITSMVTVCVSLLLPFSIYGADGTEIVLESKSAVLMDQDTGEVMFAKNEHDSMPLASVTKIMTMLLAYEAEAKGQFGWEDIVTVSEHAAGMGGSQVYLEAGEQQTAHDMMKCIAIASANDAAVAMAEFVAGSEEAFVVQMNERARELGMEDTQFVNACGLDADGHYSSAYDIALMSRELMSNFPEIQEFTTTWQDTIVHSTKRGDEEFGLTNTNKLIQWYPDTTGLKTGSTGNALYCFSGTAERDDMRLIATIMAAPDYKIRFEEAMTLLDYGFNNFVVEKGYEIGRNMGYVSVEKGSLDEVEAVVAEEISVLLPKGETGEWETKIDLLPVAKAPIQKDAKIGELIYLLNGEEVGRSDLIAAKEVAKASLQEILEKMLVNWC